jgi:hypothetical protein
MLGVGAGGIEQVQASIAIQMVRPQTIARPVVESPESLETINITAVRH